MTTSIGIILPPTGGTESRVRSMYLIVTSALDAASMNIRNRLLELSEWEEEGSFAGHPVRRRDHFLMITNEQHHIYAEELDSRVREAGIRFDSIIFASRHRAASGMRSLTVHPIGNFGEAKYGGRPGTLVPSMPSEMSFAYRRLLVYGGELGYEITFEATHHGPFLTTPTMFIEIGSDEERWGDEAAGEAVARTILDIPGAVPSAEILVGAGGGHYCPRHSDVAREFDVDFGHIVPGWALGDADDEALLMPLKNTPGARRVYLHRKALKGAQRRRLEALYTERGYEIVRSRDLSPR